MKRRTLEVEACRSEVVNRIFYMERCTSEVQHCTSEVQCRSQKVQASGSIPSK